MSAIWTVAGETAQVAAPILPAAAPIIFTPVEPQIDPDAIPLGEAGGLASPSGANWVRLANGLCTIRNVTQPTLTPAVLRSACPIIALALLARGERGP